jgi:MFS superfamily sulfate permease-like transporter
MHPDSTTAVQVDNFRAHWGDFFAGISVAGVLLPEAVAYAAIAGVPAIHALLAALIGLCVYPFFGTSRFAIVAPTSSAAAVFAASMNSGGVDMGYALVGLTGALFLLAGVLRAGFLGAFISRPVLRGFAWGLAVTIMLKQLPHIAGIHVVGAQAVQIASGLWREAAQVHLPSLQLGVAALALWLLMQHGMRRLVFVPQSLIVLALGIVAAAYFDLQASGIVLVGQIEWQALSLHLPDIATDHWLRAAEVAPALLLILFAESWGSIRSLALQKGDTVDANREMLAFGSANLLSALLQGLPVGAGFSAASANYAAGGRSKWAGVVAAAALALLLWRARSWLALLPVPVLAAVVVGILSHNLWPRAVIRGLRLGGDAWLAVTTALAVLFFGVLFGMLLAVGLSLLLAIRRFSQPLVSELGKLPGTRDYLDSERHAEVIRTPGVLIMRPEEPLFFANAEQVFQVILRRVLQAQSHTVVLSLEASDDLDATAIEALAEFTATLQKSQGRLLLARVKDRPRAAIKRGGLIAKPDSPVAVYWSVDDAVQATTPIQGEHEHK